MPSDPDHVLDAIDGAVEDWEALSADAMRWAPPEKRRDDLLGEMTDIFGPLANALTQAFRPMGEALMRSIEGSPVGRLLELTGGDEEEDDER
ncbi:hypothetical protein [Nonomuraea sediminis]|uniref:hypothetical protein n=1 Tax=Nonomuraea sediminis TaxID=2835864 RepID=UPI001BDC3BCA|nr:hypothetical protein [Nonomuraea sediminis]